MKRQLIVSFCICSILVTFTPCAQFLKHNLHMISSVCFLTRLTIRICIMCRYLFSSLTFTQIWPIFGPCLSRSPSSYPSPDSSHSLSSFAFTMLSRFFIRLRNVTRSGAPRQDCHTSNHWCVLYHYHYYYYYYYYNKNKWAVSEWVWFFDVFGFGGRGDSRGHFTQWGC